MIRTHCVHMSTDVTIRGYFSEAKRSWRSKTFGRDSLGVFTGKGYFVVFLVVREYCLNLLAPELFFFLI